MRIRERWLGADLDILFMGFCKDMTRGIAAEREGQLISKSMVTVSW